MAQDLSGLYISQSFQNLVQRSASGAFNVLATATGTEFIPVSASYAISSSHADDADNAISASYALTASVALNVTPDNLQSVLQQGNSASIDLILSASSGGDGIFRMFNDGTTNLIDIDNAAGGQLLYQAGASNNRFVIQPNGDQQGEILFSSNSSIKTAKYTNNSGDIILDPSASAASDGAGSVIIQGLLNAPYNAEVSQSLGVTGSATITGSVFVSDKIQVNSPTLGSSDKVAVKGNVYISDGALIASGSTALQLLVAGQGVFGIGNSNNASAEASLTVGANNSNQANSGLISGKNNTIDVNKNESAILAGTDHNMRGEKSAIIGGESNTMNSSFSGIFGAAAATVTNADTSVILGGYQQQLQGSRTYLLGGNDNQVTNAGAEFSGIIGGQAHRIALPVTASAIIGGKSITANASETVYVPNLDLQAGKKLTMSGSIELAGSVGTAGQVIGVDASGIAKWQAAGGGGGGSTQLSGSNYIFVSGSGTEAENATELQAAFTIGAASIPNGSVRSATNRFTVVVAPGNYDFTAADLDWNSLYVDFRSLTGERDVYFSNATYTFSLNTNDARITGIDCGTKPFKVTTNLANVIVNKCKGGNDSFGTSQTISGTYIDCESGGTSFAGNGGTASGTFINCKAEGQNLGFGALFGASTGVFENCFIQLNFAGYATAQGSYTRCGGLNEFLRNGVGASGRVYNCVAVGNNNYGTATNTDILGQVLNSITGTNGTGIASDLFPGVGTGGKLVNSIDGLFTVNNIVN